MARARLRGLRRSTSSSLQSGFPLNRNLYARFVLVLAVMTVLVAARPARAQQTNPVDRQVTNPITDTPNVNPLTQEQPIRPQLPAERTGQSQDTETLTV